MRTFNGAARTSSAPAGVYSKGLPPMWCWCRGAALLVALWGCTVVAEQLQVRWRWDGPGTLVVECAFPAPRFAVREGRSVQLPPESRWAFRLPQQPFYGFAVPLECPPEARLQGLEIVEQELLPLPAPPALLECRECAPVASTVVELVPLGFAGSSARAVLRLLPYRAVRDSLQAIRQLRVRLSLPSVARFAVVDALASVERVAVARTLQPDVALRPIPTAPDGWQYKLYVSRQGLVRLTARELAQLGLPIATLELQTLQLWNRGQQVPLYVYDRNNNGRLEHYEPDPDYIAFFAEPNLKNFQNPDADQYRDPESDENVYVLTWGTAPGARMVEESGELRITDPRRATDLRGKYFLSTVILEENRVQERFGAVETWDRDLLQPSFRGDQLFWARVAPNASVTVRVPLPAPATVASEPVQLEVMLCGALVSAFPCPGPEHTAEIYLNQRRVLRASWSGARAMLLQTPRDQIAPIPASVLTEAENSTLTVANILNCTEAGDRAPALYLNWVRVRYPRLYRAVGDELLFTVPPGAPPGVYTFALEGFRSPNVMVFRVGISRIVNVTVERVTQRAGGTTYTVRFQTYVASPQELFYAVAVDSLRGPERMERDLPSQLATSVGADYVLLTHKGIWDRRSAQATEAQHPVERLLRLRRQQGLSAMAVDVEDIYDEFNHGIASSRAIADFLRYAWHNWSRPPRYVVLLGTAEAIPPQHWQTRRWGMTPTDYPYGCVEGMYQSPTGAVVPDPIAEIAVGRIPARTLAEADAVVSKLEQYESALDADYFLPRALLVAGVNGFVQQTELLAERLPDGVSQRRLYVGQPPERYGGHTAELVQLWDRGAAVVNFLGHGGGGIWEDAGLFRDEDVALLNNRGRYPVVSSLTCFTGAFEQQVYRRGLLTTLLLAAGKGAVAAWGNSGFGWLENSFFLSAALLESFFAAPRSAARLGDVFRAGKLLYLARAYGLQNEIVLSMLLQATLLGDPAMLLRLPTDTVQLQAQRGWAYPGEQVELTAQIPFSGVARIVLADERGNDLEGSEQRVEFSAPQLRFWVRVPQGYSGQQLRVRLYAVESGGRRAVFGGLRLSTGAVLFGAIQWEPTPPQPGQPLWIQLPVRSRDALRRVWATVSMRLPDGTLQSLGELSCSVVAPELYRTDVPVPAGLVLPGAEVRALFGVELQSGQIQTTPLESVVVPGLADPAVFPPRAGADSLPPAQLPLRMVPTAQGARLRVRLFNWTETPASGVPARVERLLSDGSVQLLAAQRVDLPGNGTLDWLIAVPAVLPRSLVRVALEPDSLSVGGNRLRLNDVGADSVLLSCFALLPGIGSSADGSATQWVGQPGTVLLQVPAPQAPAQPALVCVEALPSAEVQQPGIHPVRLSDGSAALRITVEPAGVRVRAVLQVWYAVQDTNLRISAPALYRRHSRLPLWQRIPTEEPQPGLLQASLELPTTVMVATTSDRRPPQVRITAEGRALPTRSVISANPRIGIVAVDENGIATDTASIQLLLDGQPVPPTEYALLDTAVTMTAAALSYRPRLQSGKHILCAVLHDCAGNASERTCVQLEVSTQLELRVLGTFPNPFAEEMFLAYELLGSSNVDEVEVRFYTASGRSIRRMVFPTTIPTEAYGFLRGGTGLPTAPGYHEVWWDGTDDDGQPVANGVYFYRIRVRAGDTVIERRGSVARVR